MDKTDIDYINNAFTSQDWIKVTQKVSEEALPVHSGKIEIDTSKGTLLFDINVSPDFPLGRIDFTCTSHRGYGHMMHYGLLCLNTPPSTTIFSRLATELEKLHLWVNKYFIEEHIDAHFEYYYFWMQQDMTVVFEENQDKQPVTAGFGKFEYAELNRFTISDITQRCWIALNLGGRICNWSKTFVEHYKKTTYSGLWIKIDKHPVIARRQTIENWKDLLSLLSPGQAKFLHDDYRTIRSKSCSSDYFILMIGYDIPNNQNSEVHWDTVIVRFNDFPYTAVKNPLGTYWPSDLGYKVDWGKSLNASYERLFGRGKLSQQLTHKKILLIGTGAIGSQLFEILLRGGCRHIELCEPDVIEPGNICRGDFSFVNVQKPKLYELYNKAIDVSPYIEITFRPETNNMARDNKEYSFTKQALHGFDYIFDCSADKYLSIMLDDMQLNGQVLNFSISNEASHMAVITGIGNIHVTKSILYDRLVPKASEPFFVATGCWHPTFKASYTDISVLLSYAINEINNRLNEGIPVSSFFIKKHAEYGKHLNYELTYNV